MNAPAKLTALELFEEARRDVIAEALCQLRPLVEECLTAAISEETRSTIHQIHSLAERYAKLNDFYGVATNVGRMLEIKRVQLAVKRSRMEHEQGVLYKRLRHIVTLKFESAETEEEIDRLNEILNDLTKVSAQEPIQFAKAIKNVISRIEKL